MKNELITGIWTTVAGASLLGGGTMVLKSHNDNAVQDVAIQQVQDQQLALDDTLKQLDQSVRALDKSVAVLSEKVKAKE